MKKIILIKNIKILLYASIGILIIIFHAFIGENPYNSTDIVQGEIDKIKNEAVEELKEIKIKERKGEATRRHILIFMVSLGLAVYLYNKYFK